MEQLKFKNFAIEQTKADESGNLIIEGYGAVFGNIDSYGDIIEKGAFGNTLSERRDRIAFAYQHDIWNPIGKILELREDEKGLWLKVMLSAAEKDIQTKVKEGILQELSIGYKEVSAHREVRDKNEVNVVTEIKLYEISLVTVAANPLARIEGMKADEKRDFLQKEFDRLIAIVRNDNINFELNKLKSLIFSAEVETHEQPPKEEGLKKGDILKILNGK
mgnify:FL=1